MHGMPVIFTEAMEDGSMMCDGRNWYVGTFRKPEHLTPVQKEGRAAALHVREQMADILEWLGEPVDRWSVPLHKQLMDKIARGAKR